MPTKRKRKQVKRKTRKRKLHDVKDSEHIPTKRKKAEEITVLTLENMKIFIEGANLCIEAWDTDFGVGIHHNELKTGHVTLRIRLSPEDMEKIIKVLLRK